MKLFTLCVSSDIMLSKEVVKMDKKYMREFGERVKARREELGMTQLDLALKIGYKSKQAICKIETGDRGVSVEKVNLLADALRIPLDVLVGSSEQDLIDELVDELKGMPEDTIRSLLQTVRNLKSL